MPRTYAYSANFDKDTEKLFKDAKLLGEGHNGIVYELPEEKAIKIFQDSKCCKDESNILKKVKSDYFPRVHSTGEYYIVRDMVYGRRLDHYIKKNGFNYELSENLYKLILEFKRLKFTKLDARCRDIYVGDDKEVMVIDPKQCYKRKVNYPRHLMKGLYKLGVLESFIEDLRIIDKKVADDWEKKFNNYITENENSI